ncbi:cytochrome c oxidase assembly protein COX11, mitochondrial isoform X1 [Aristolochia californica]|uniref:cytochrome c oxidase assembly protein COX11, mitochondrial isoform X1 n=2 Tax=Aristolochia californica TaxID=171875 RepID=UPI0035DEBF22
MIWLRNSSKVNILHHLCKVPLVTPSVTGLCSEAIISSNKAIGDLRWLHHSRTQFHWLLFNNRLSGLPSAQRTFFSPITPQQFERLHSCSFQRSYVSQASINHKSKTTLIYLTALVFAMVGCTYAAVPLYRRFCQATGYGGTVQRKESVEEKIARHSRDGTVTSRDIVVQFNADVADGLQWKFTPTQREVRIKPGESALAFYTAENCSSTPITGVSTYNVTPMKAAIYFNKIQCFCFEEQRLLPGEQIDMPVFFYIDPEFETDPKMDGINNLILSYTFFKTKDG